jgi:hypothetical protein
MRIKIERESVKVSTDKLDKLRAYSSEFGKLADLLDSAIDLKLAELVELQKHREFLKGKEISRDKGFVLMYDLCTVPRNMKFEDVSKRIKEKGECLWDSRLGASAPFVFDLGGDKNSYLKDIKIIDIAGNPGEFGLE